MKVLFYILLIILGPQAWAQTIRYEVRTVEGVAIPSIARTTTQATCDAVIREMVGEYHCHRITIGSGTTPPPAPPASAPDPVPTPAPIPAPAGSPVTVYISDCAPGAAPGCVQGNDANPGTQASPKRTIQGAGHNTLPAGSQVLFARGGAWDNFNIALYNLNATTANPITLDAYGTGPYPWLKTAVANAFFVGGNFNYSDTVSDGGYTIRNLKIDGQGTSEWGFLIVAATRGVVIESNEITGFKIAVHFQNMGSGNDGLVIRSNNIHHNSDMGMLGDANNMVIEGNIVADNNYSGSGFNHGLYLGGHAHDGIVRNNTFTNNSAVNGSCSGGNLTVHGQWDGLLIENNTITQQAYGPGCYGISVNDGYTSVEWFRKVVIRGNTVLRVQCGACIRAAPEVLIDGNTFDADAAVSIGAPTDATDDQGANPVLRNNRVCRGTISLNVPGAVQTGTVTGACP